MRNNTIVVRLKKEQFNRIKETAKQQDQTTSAVIRDCIQAYYNPLNTYNQDLVTTLKAEITDLRQQRDTLQQRVDYLMLPWYRRLFYRPQLIDHK